MHNNNKIIETIQVEATKEGYQDGQKGEYNSKLSIWNFFPSEEKIAADVAYDKGYIAGRKGHK